MQLSPVYKFYQEKMEQQIELDKKDYMEKSRERLSAWIYDYISKREKNYPEN